MNNENITLSIFVPCFNEEKNITKTLNNIKEAVQKEMIELPAGKLNENENPEYCAIRELEEEIGYRSEKLPFLTHIHPAVGLADEVMGLYLAENLIKTAPKQDEDEFLELMPISLKNAVKMVWD